jgi:hypothetical protein
MRTQLLSLLAALSCAPLISQAGTSVGIGIGVGAPPPYPPGAVVIPATPPPPQAEVVTIAPGPNFVWVTGHWAWQPRGRRHWTWVRGTWIARPSQAAVWTPGHWVAAEHGWVWVEGQWTVPAVPPPGPAIAGEAIVQEAPPAPIAERRPRHPPGPDFFWIAGHWAWNGGWVWQPGRFEHRPHDHPGTRWEAGRWDRRGNGYIWIEGGWR